MGGPQGTKVSLRIFQVFWVFSRFFLVSLRCSLGSVQHFLVSLRYFLVFFLVSLRFSEFYFF